MGKGTSVTRTDLIISHGIVTPSNENTVTAPNQAQPSRPTKNAEAKHVSANAATTGSGREGNLGIMERHFMALAIVPHKQLICI